MPHGPLRSTGMRRLASALALLLLCAVTAGAAAWATSPTPSALQARVETWLGKAAGTRVGLGAVPAVLREAVVATEDERFYHHHGIDLIGIVRALPYDITHLTFGQGASTITEQVAKVLYLGGNDHSPWRKLEDAAVAWKLENRYTKSQILAAYLNSAYFGEHAYGIDAASERYFGLPPRRLTAAQASLLAGLIQAPSRYDPYRHPALARSRQAEVLRSLVRTGRLTVSRAASVLARPLRLRSGAVLPAVRGVDLAPGPAFVWWQLLLGAGVIVTACAALVATRLRRVRLLPGVVLLRLVLAAAAVVGATAIVRSFRTA